MQTLRADKFGSLMHSKLFQVQKIIKNPPVTTCQLSPPGDSTNLQTSLFRLFLLEKALMCIKLGRGNPDCIKSVTLLHSGA